VRLLTDPSACATPTLVRRCGILFAALALVSCDKVEHSKKEAAVGSLTTDEECTIRRPWLPDTPVDSRCVTSLRGPDGGTLQRSIYVAIPDPGGRVVAATADGRPRGHVWLYDAKTASSLGDQNLPCASSYPTWSPDGTAFATSCWPDGRGLWVTAVPLAGDSVMVDKSYVASGDAWSPSGRKLAYVLGASNRAGHGHAELWVWDRASATKSKVVEREFVSWDESTAWPGWIGEEPHLCGKYFVHPDPDCARATRPK
jgi:hypothetical protein